MQIRIPSQSNPVLQQVNDSSILGTLNGSFNIDLTSDIGKVKTTKTLLSKGATTAVSGDFGGIICEGVGAIATLNSNIWMVSGDALWVGGNSPSDSIAKDTSTGTLSCQYQDSDLKSFNSALIAVNQSNVYRYNPGTVTWTSIHAFATSGLAHLLEVHGLPSHAYFTFDEYKIGRVDTSWTVSTTGTGTFNPNLPGYSISFIKSDGNKLWIGYMNTYGGANETTFIMTWDGVTENVASAQYKIDARGILAGTIVNGVPYVVDTNGRLLAFNGSFFQKVASFPLKASEYLYGIGTKFNQRAIHPNGMYYDAITEEILINVSNAKRINSTTDIEFYEFPGGVWSYKKETGLTHKYSPSLQPIASSGTDNLIDYGQFNTYLNGAVVCLGLRASTGEKGRVLFGCTVSTGNSVNLENASISRAGLFTNDTENTAQNYAYLYTPEIHSSKVLETWQNIYITYQKMFSLTDKIVVKYRTKNYEKQNVSVTWSDIDTLTTTDDISNFVVGDEIQIVQGAGSGASLHIKTISESLGTYTIKLDDSLPSGVIGQTAIAQFDKWEKLGTITSADSEQWKQFSVQKNAVSPFIKLKVAMRFTNENGMYGAYITSNEQIS